MGAQNQTKQQGLEVGRKVPGQGKMMPGRYLVPNQLWIVHLGLHNELEVWPEFMDCH